MLPTSARATAPTVYTDAVLSKSGRHGRGHTGRFCLQLAQAGTKPDPQLDARWLAVGGRRQ